MEAKPRYFMEGSHGTTVFSIFRGVGSGFRFLQMIRDSDLDGLTVSPHLLRYFTVRSVWDWRLICKICLLTDLDSIRISSAYWKTCVL